MERASERVAENKKKVHVKGYTTGTGRTVPDHHRTMPESTDAPKGTFIERRLINPKKYRF